MGVFVYGAAIAEHRFRFLGFTRNDDDWGARNDRRQYRGSG